MALVVPSRLRVATGVDWVSLVPPSLPTWTTRKPGAGTSTCARLCCGQSTVLAQVGTDSIADDPDDDDVAVCEASAGGCENAALRIKRDVASRARQHQGRSVHPAAGHLAAAGCAASVPARRPPERAGRRLDANVALHTEDRILGGIRGVAGVSGPSCRRSGTAGAGSAEKSGRRSRPSSAYRGSRQAVPTISTPAVCARSR